MIELLKFKSEAEWLEARKQDVTSTDVSVMLGLSIYKTKFALWHEKAGNAKIQFEENELMKWGRRLQNTIAAGICEDEGWKGEDLGLVYLRDPISQLGTSLDVKIITPSMGNGLMEVKNVSEHAFRKNWDRDAVPIGYELQLQTQLHLCKKKGLDIGFGVIAALVGGHRKELYFRDYDPEVGEMIEAEAFKFWQSIRDGKEPLKDFKADYKILDMVKTVTKGAEIDLSENNRIHELCDQYIQAGEDENNAKERKEIAKAEILDIMGDAEKGTLKDFSISASYIDGKSISYYRQPYRYFKITDKREGSENE